MYIGDIMIGIGGLFFILIFLLAPRWSFTAVGFWFMAYAVFNMHTLGYKWNYELGFLIGALMLHFGLEKAFKRP